MPLLGMLCPWSKEGALRAVAALLAPLLFSCATIEQWIPAASSPASPARHAGEAGERELDRIASLEREVVRLRADLEQAEATMLATDSEVRAGRNRAAAVSVLAEALISIDQAARSAPWRSAAIGEARLKLAEAERLLQSGNPPACVYFASRGQRIAETLLAEAREVASSDDARFVLVERLNLRAGPSTSDPIVGVLESGTPVFAQGVDGNWVRVRTLRGELGWVHASLVGRAALDEQASGS